MCSAFIIYRSAGSRNTAVINFFVKYPLSAGIARRTDGKRPADRTACEEAGFLPYVLLMTRCPTGLGGIHP